jgi:hypothetical protein
MLIWSTYGLWHFVVHHGLPCISHRHIIEVNLLVVLHAHINVVHHLGEDHRITAVILHNDVKHDLVTKVVALLVEQHVPGAVVLVGLGSLGLDLQLEELVRPDIVLHRHVTRVELLVTRDHHEFCALGDLALTCVLEGPNVLNIITLLEHHVLLERHVVELGLEVRFGLD